VPDAVLLSASEGCVIAMLGMALFEGELSSIESIGVSRSDSMVGQSDRTELAGLSCWSSVLTVAASSSSSG
jgi:hypothetical protein